MWYKSIYNFAMLEVDSKLNSTVKFYVRFALIYLPSLSSTFWAKAKEMEM